MSVIGDYIVMIWDIVRSRAVYIDKDLQQSLTSKFMMMVRVPVTPQEMSNKVYHLTNDSALVAPLPPSSVLPEPLVRTWLGGGTEEFAAKLGWRYGDTIPNQITVAYLMDMRKGGLAGFHIVMGGKSIIATFPFSKMFGLEGRATGSPEDSISVTVDPANLSFAKNKMVSSWGPISEVFRGSLSHAGVNHDWKNGPGVYVR